MRILFINQWFDPEPMFKGLPFARALAKAGHEVQVLTGFPNYPGGKLYDGYRIRLLQREEMGGVSVLRVPLYPSHDRSGLRRAANYTSFALSAALIGPACVKGADVAYVYHPPGTVGLPAAFLRLLRGIPFVYDIQDLWPDTLRATGMLSSRALLGLLDRWCRMTYRLASRIVVLSPGFRTALIARGVPAAKIDVIYNWCDENQLAFPLPDSQLKQTLGMAGRFNVVFAGTMGRAQGLDAVLDAALLVRDRLPDVQFVLVGGGIEVDRLQQIAKERAIHNVIFLPRRPVSEIGQILSQADGLLVHLRDEPLFRITIPSKTQAYMAFGKPVLMGVKGDAAALLEKAEAGLLCEPENPHSIADTVRRLYEMPAEARREMGTRGQAYYWRELSLQAGVKRFERVFEAVASQRAT